ncbi:Aste57867_8129 [Aphanomyces stellatus]|uniref:Aste57867_8129 protein n=1 Tax=Aphanomyces stellatus TaxID=120398 RepID=A0A485KJF6_9STRA|nr:hypothetical protein As57867_008099 [Aphanomyces stellatus]VFT85018.1 Aste57867_8129 [Aphanomyces stellatus]
MSQDGATKGVIPTLKRTLTNRRQVLAQLKHTSSRVRLSRLRNSVVNIMSLRSALKAYVKHELLRRTKSNDHFQTISLGCLRKSHPVRRVCIAVVSSVWFERFITLCVLVNTILLGFVDYSDPWVDGLNPTKPANRLIDQVNTISLGIFLAEMVLKIVAHGFAWGKHSYLSEGWNRLDFVIVVSGVLSWFNGSSKVGSIRILRVLRPLRTLHSLPGLKVLTNALLASLPALWHVAIVLAFVYLIFAILGMELWSGTFNGRCRLTPVPVALGYNASNAPNATAYPPDASYVVAVVAAPDRYPCLDGHHDAMPALDALWPTPLDCFWPVDPSEPNPVLCSLDPTTGRQCGPNLTCGANFDRANNPRFATVLFNGSFVASVTYMDTFNANLNFGLTNFDNVWSAFVVILQTVTASGWMALTQTTQQAGGYVGAAIFFNALLFVGMCFLLQLNMAVLYSEFVRAKDQQRKLAKALRRQSAATKFIHAATVRHIQLAFSSFTSARFDAETKKQIRKVRRAVRGIVDSDVYTRAGLVVTVLNIATLASDHHPMDPSFSYYTQLLNFIFLVYFGLDVLVKILGLGFVGFWTDMFNRFDLLTVILGVVELVLSPPTALRRDGGDHGASSVSIFTALRAARAIKLARAWKSLHKMLLAIGAAMGEIVNFMFFLVLFLFVTSLIGMELFATKFQFDPNNMPLPYNNTNPTARVHRSNFDSMPWALFTVFQVLTYDNFPTVLYDGWLVAGSVAPLYIAFIVVCGTWLVMNMFSAILVESVLVDDDVVDSSTQHVDVSDDDDDDDDDSDDDGQLPPLPTQPKSRAFRLLQLTLRRFVDHHATTLSSRVSSLAALAAVHTKFEPHDKSLGLFGPRHPLRRVCLYLLQRPEYTAAVVAAIAVSCLCTAFDSPLLDRTAGLGLWLDRLNVVFAALFALEMSILLVAHGAFLGEHAYVQDAWQLLDGFIVVVSIVPLVVPNVGALSGLRALRTCRALRPLRVINKLPQLKVVVNVLFRCGPDIGRTLLFFFFMLVMFGIMSVMLFKGALATCSISPYTYGLDDNNAHPPWFPPTTFVGDYQSNLTDVDVMTYPRPWRSMTPALQAALAPVWNQTGCGPFSDSYTPTSKEVCLCFATTPAHTTWDAVVPQRFDNIFESVGALYELTTMEGWSAVAIASVDAVGPDMQPIVNNRPVLMVYWWLFMIVCAFFMTNLFIGVLCQSFVRETYGAMVTEEQIQWVKMQRKVMALAPHRVYPVPQHAPLRALCHRIVHSASFESSMTATTLVNLLLMAGQAHGQSQRIQAILDGIYIGVVAAFSAEALLKGAAFGPSYLLDVWHRLDVAVLTLSWLNITLTVVGHVDLGLLESFIRVARVTWMLRLIRRSESLKNLFDTLLVSLPAVTNVTALLLLLYYISAAVAVQLFATVALNGQMITEFQNFQTFWVALQTLIGFSTGENWDTFLWQVYNTVPATNPTCVDREFNATMCGFRTSPGCVPLDGCGSSLIVPFMYTFFLLLGYLGINLFSGIVVDAIGDSSAASPVNAVTLSAFADKWALFDPTASGLITASQLTDFLLEMPPPFGFQGVAGYSRKRVAVAIGDLNIPIYDEQYVHFKDVPRALVQRIMGNGEPAKMREIGRVMDELGVSKRFDELWQKNRRRQSDDLKSRSLKPSSIYMANIVVARFVRRYRARKAARVRLATLALGTDDIEAIHDMAVMAATNPLVEEEEEEEDPSPIVLSPKVIPIETKSQLVDGGKPVHLAPLAHLNSKSKYQVVVPINSEPPPEGATNDP